MAKNNKRRKANNKSNTKQEVKHLESKTEDLKKQHNITDEELNKEITNSNTENITEKSVKELYHKNIKIGKILEKKQKELDLLKEKTKSEKEKVEKEIAQTKKTREELERSLRKYDTELTEINKLQVSQGFVSIIDRKLLDSYQEKLKFQEEVLLEKIAELQNKHTDYISTITSLETKKIALEKDFQIKYNKLKDSLKQNYQDKFQNKENQLEKLEKELKKKERELKNNTEDFDDEKDYLEEKAKRKVAKEIATLNFKVEGLNDKNEALKNEYTRIKDQLKHLGTYQPKEIVKELRKKEKTINELSEKLATSPDVLKIDELKQLRIEKNKWQEDLRNINADLNEYKTRYSKQKLQIGEKERLEFEKEELENRIKLQKVALDELKEEVNDLTKQSEDKVTFSNCSEMDEKYNKEELPPTNEISKEWINNIQHVIAKVTKDELFYDIDLLRTFIAGLAMSKFSILQGISGTGKTSLPKAFTKAVGGHFGIVEVQSGWKDRQDLIGYYNTFEKKYYEGKFLRYLYMAGTPEYKNKPFFIILDEMNLSHPEHYFADMLSLMEETNPENQNLTISDKVKDIPELMINLEEGGIGLKIPQNVWFIGTANHDETTLQFAPKTYDRASVLEMPININRFNIKSIDPQNTKISNKTFLDFFEKQRWLKKDKKTLDYLNGTFKDVCNELGLGWGNRLEKHIKRFTPTFKALGGTDATALDHLIASKILRSLKGRYDIQKESLEKMKSELESNFKKTFNGEALKSLKIIETELKRIS